MAVWKCAVAGDQESIMSRSFSQASRLLKPADFKRVFNQAAISSDRLFRVFACMGSGTRSRLGIAVSRKVDRRAVGRNRIKRVIRESFRNKYAGSAHRTGETGKEQGDKRYRDYVVVASPPSAHAENAQLRASLASLWQKVDARLDKKTADAANQSRNI